MSSQTKRGSEQRPSASTSDSRPAPSEERSGRSVSGSGIAPRGERTVTEYARDVSRDAPQVDRDTPFGATLTDTGILFRVWAPNAREAYVVTEADITNGWTAWQPLASRRLDSLGDGSFGGFLAGLSDGARYLFWIKGPEGGTEGFKRDPYARELGTEPAFPSCPCIARLANGYPWRCRDWKTPRRAEFIIYQLHIGVFWARSATGQDARKQYGRFLDVIERLPYLKDLGVTALQFLPVQEFDNARGLGYAGLDFFSPEMAYQIGDTAELDRHLETINAMLDGFGLARLTRSDIQSGPNQLKVLVDLCHLHGLSVIFDLVYNHAGGGFGDRSLYFYDRQAAGDDNRSLYFTDQGWAGGKVFAFWQQGVRRFLIENARFFLDEYLIDGIRYDEVTVIHHHGGDDFCRELTGALRSHRPDLLQVAEYWDWDRELPITPTSQGGLGFDAGSDDRLRNAIRGLLARAATGQAARLDFDAVASAMYPRGSFAGHASVQALEDHDIVRWDYGTNTPRAPRIASLADPSNPRSYYACSRARVAAGLLLTAPGIPLIFMGQEMLEDKPWHDDVDNWGQFLISWDGLDQSPEVRDYHRFMRDLIALRRNQPALRDGRYQPYHIHNDNRVFAYRRSVDNGSDLVVVANLREQAWYDYGVGIPRRGHWREIFNGDAYQTASNPPVTGNGSGIDADGPSMHGMPASAAITIPANGFLVLAFDHA
jgi:1,4-alpha-glucan branching enzyme